MAKVWKLIGRLFLDNSSKNCIGTSINERWTWYGEMTTVCFLFLALISWLLQGLYVFIRKQNNIISAYISIYPGSICSSSHLTTCTFYFSSCEFWNKSPVLTILLLSFQKQLTFGAPRSMRDQNLHLYQRKDSIFCLKFVEWPLEMSISNIRGL